MFYLAMQSYHSFLYFVILYFTSSVILSCPEGWKALLEDCFILFKRNKNLPPSPVNPNHKVDNESITEYCNVHSQTKYCITKLKQECANISNEFEDELQEVDDYHFHEGDVYCSRSNLCADMVNNLICLKTLQGDNEIFNCFLRGAELFITICQKGIAVFQCILERFRQQCGDTAANLMQPIIPTMKILEGTNNCNYPIGETINGNHTNKCKASNSFDENSEESIHEIDPVPSKHSTVSNECTSHCWAASFLIYFLFLGFNLIL